MVLEVIFWVSLLLICTPYCLYPVCLLVLGAFRQRSLVTNQTPSVTLLISVYNEEAVIRDKLENCLSLDYPRECLEIVVISDASTDRTDHLVAGYACHGVRLRRQERRRGKSAGLARFVPEAAGEILIFSDANSLYEPDAIRKLVRHFTDPQIGFVAGSQRYEMPESAASRSESLYWRYETWVKILESRVGSLVGGDGAILAMRARLFEPLREDDINDFYLPLRMVMRGYRGVFDQEAICYERAAGSFRGEFYRKLRIVSRSLRAVMRVPRALNPFHVGTFAFQLIAHKVLRWFVPWLLATVLLVNIALALSGNTFYQVSLGLQLAFYVTALCRFVPWLGTLRPVTVCYYFCVVNMAAGLGVLATVCGYRFATWTPQRTAEQQAAAST